MTGIEAGQSDSSESRGSDIEMTGASNNDQDFIAHASQDIPNLLRYITQLKDEIKQLKHDA